MNYYQIANLKLEIVCQHTYIHLQIDQQTNYVAIQQRTSTGINGTVVEVTRCDLRAKDMFQTSPNLPTTLAFQNWPSGSTPELS